MYISRIKLDTRLKDAQRAIASPQVMHAMLANCFSEKNRILWRVDNLSGKMYLLVVSENSPDFSTLEPQVCNNGDLGETKNYTRFLSGIKDGQKLRFRFRGNPIRNIPGKDGERGKVVPHVSDEYKRKWLVDVAGRNGFIVEPSEFLIVDSGMHRFYKSNKGKPVQITHATFEGMLTVTDSELFTAAMCKGIGRAKAYGCGLMTVMMYDG